ncbi:Transmembrane protein [Forsythia ovata]|uniref:Transmembrane protein n=1 Tax=Forsythia ovata TaxID=205694 RepID=A0ABD1VJ58_9LAMI
MAVTEPAVLILTSLGVCRLIFQSFDDLKSLQVLNLANNTYRMAKELVNQGTQYNVAIPELYTENSSYSLEEHPHTHKVFLLCNYILLGAACSCIFLTLSLRLIPSLCGFFLILLHVTTIIGAIVDCAAASAARGARKWNGAHMVATVLTSIFQGSVSVLIYTRPKDFLGNLKSYVRE